MGAGRPSQAAARAADRSGGIYSCASEKRQDRAKLISSTASQLRRSSQRTCVDAQCTFWGRRARNGHEHRKLPLANEQASLVRGLCQSARYDGRERMPQELRDNQSI